MKTTLLSNCLLGLEHFKHSPYTLRKSVQYIPYLAAIVDCNHRYKEEQTEQYIISDLLSQEAVVLLYACLFLMRKRFSV